MNNCTYSSHMAEAIIAVITDDGKRNNDLAETIRNLLPLTETVTPDQRGQAYETCNETWTETCTELTETRIRNLLQTADSTEDAAARLSLVIDGTLAPPPYVSMMTAISNLATPADALFWAQDNRQMLDECHINP